MTKTLAEVIDQLRSEKRANRKLDVQIGEAAGYREVTEPGHPPYSWHYPDGRIARLPRFTGSLDYAFELLQLVAPGNVGACTWHESHSVAALEEGPHCQAATPALAICLAAMVELQKNGGKIPA